MSVVLRPQTVVTFGLAQKDGRIDLHELAMKSQAAFVQSEEALKAANAIANGSLWNRVMKARELQKHTLQTIEHIRNISAVNIALSALCNDLAAQNLDQANRIESHQRKAEHATMRMDATADEILVLLRRNSLASELEDVKSKLHQEVRRLEDRISQGAESQAASLSDLSKSVDALTAKGAKAEERLTSRITDLSGDLSQRNVRLASEVRDLDSKTRTRLEILDTELTAERSTREGLGAEFDARLMRLTHINAELLRAGAKSRTTLAACVAGLLLLQAGSLVFVMYLSGV